MIKRIFYSSGPGDIISAHRYWKNHEHCPTEVSITVSSQIQDFCRDINAAAYFVANYPRREKLTDGAFTLELRPKPAYGGVRFHLGEIRYGLGLLATAVRFRAQVALVDSGSTHYFVLMLFPLFGIRVVPILHNTLWPNGFPPVKATHRMTQWVNSFFWRWFPTAAIAVSPECERQINQVRRKKHYPIYQMRPQFRPEYFARIPPPPSHEQRPFRVMFIGRVTRPKGVFDILEMARKIENTHPELVRWEICGRGPDLDELTRVHRELKLEGIVDLRGWTSLDDLVDVYARSHASIVPTRGSFIEGLAATAVEAILAGRPVVTNPVVPALEILRSACVEAKTDDVDSHRDAVLKLATDADLYRRTCAACAGYQQQFYDSACGQAEVLKQALAPYI